MGMEGLEVMSDMLLPFRCRLRRDWRVVRISRSEKALNSLNSRLRVVRVEDSVARGRSGILVSWLAPLLRLTREVNFVAT